MINSNYNMTEIELPLQVMSLFDDKYKVKINPSKTVYELKKMISKLCYRDPQEIRLIYCGAEMNDSRTVQSYEIQKASFIHMVFIGKPIRLNITSICGLKISLDISKDATLKDLKNAIKESNNIPLKNQNLIFCGKRMNDDDKKLIDYKVDTETTIHLVITESNKEKVEKLLNNMEEIIQNLFSENQRLRKEIKLLKITQNK